MFNTQRLITTIILFCVGCLPLSAQNTDSLNEYFRQLERHHKFMGSVYVIKGKEVLFNQSYGYLDEKFSKKLNDHTRYRIGSISKIFTSVLILQAQERGLLSIDQNIETYFPELPNASSISIKHLLNHTSGIDNITAQNDYLNWYTIPQTRSELLHKIMILPSLFSAGTQVSYSNSNYILLTLILEDVYKDTFENILYEHLTSLYDWKSIVAGHKIQVENNEALSFNYEGKWVRADETDPSVPLGAGAITSDIKDLVDFLYQLFQLNILSQSSLDLMTTTQDQMGLGIFPMPYYSEQSWGHTGGIDGFSSIVATFPSTGLTLAILSNALNYNMNDIALTVLEVMNERSISIPEFKEILVDPTILAQYVGDYTSELIPIHLTITLENGVLFAQATGQSKFPLSPQSDEIFEFEMAGVQLQFIAQDRKLILKQNGMEFEFHQHNYTPE